MLDRTFAYESANDQRNQMKAGTEPKSEKLIDLLLRLVSHIKVLDHQPGRVALRLTLSGLKLIQENEISGLTEAIPGILDTRMKWWSRAVEIDYDAEQLPYDLWESLLNLGEKPEQTDKVRARLATVLKTHS
jgi:hypothetical protein